MALINCPECGKEVSDKAPACPNCGYRINPIDFSSLQDPPRPAAPAAPPPAAPAPADVSKLESKRRADWKTIAAAAVLAVALIAIAVLLIVQKRDRDYAEALHQARVDMLLDSQEASDVANMIYSIWGNAIYHTNDAATDEYTLNGTSWRDFNDALSIYFSSLDYEFAVDSISKKLDKSRSAVSDLRNPPKAYSEQYDILKQMFSAYSDLCRCATDPSGTLSEYGDSLVAASHDLLSLYNDLLVILPYDGLVDGE